MHRCQCRAKLITLKVLLGSALQLKVVVVAEIFKVVVECSPSVLRIGVLFAMFSLSSFHHITFRCANATSSDLSRNQ